MSAPKPGTPEYEEYVQQKRRKAHGEVLSPEESARVLRMLDNPCPNCFSEPLEADGSCVRCGNIQKVGTSESESDANPR